jgi:hypothetical protein
VITFFNRKEMKRRLVFSIISNNNTLDWSVMAVSLVGYLSIGCQSQASIASPAVERSQFGTEFEAESSSQVFFNSSRENIVIPLQISEIIMVQDYE